MSHYVEQSLGATGQFLNDGLLGVVGVKYVYLRRADCFSRWAVKAWDTVTADLRKTSEPGSPVQEAAREQSSEVLNSEVFYQEVQIVCE